jgi:hypothetical protein
MPLSLRLSLPSKGIVKDSGYDSVPERRSATMDLGQVPRSRPRSGVVGVRRSSPVSRGAVVPKFLSNRPKLRTSIAVAAAGETQAAQEYQTEANLFGESQTGDYSSPALSGVAGVAEGAIAFGLTGAA